MRIALVGADPATKQGAPYGEADCAIWACSMRHMAGKPDGSMGPDIPRWDAWFELHVPMGLHVPSGKVVEDYAAWVRTQPAVYVRDPKEMFAGAIAYPEAELKKQFGPFFFTSSVAYMMALAIAQGPTEISVWGVTMQCADYRQQIPGFHYFTQRAREAGITVTVPKGSTLFNTLKDEW
jgi:hypothetical protein